MGFIENYINIFDKLKCNFFFGLTKPISVSQKADDRVAKERRKGPFFFVMVDL